VGEDVVNLPCRDHTFPLRDEPLALQPALLEPGTRLTQRAHVGLTAADEITDDPDQHKQDPQEHSVLEDVCQVFRGDAPPEAGEHAAAERGTEGEQADRQGRDVCGNGIDDDRLRDRPRTSHIKPANVRSSILGCSRDHWSMRAARKVRCFKGPSIFRDRSAETEAQDRADDRLHLLGEGRG
jgi:hypothetical protein